MILKCVTLLYFFCEAEQLPKLRFKLFYSNTEKSSGGARSASYFYLTESNSAAELAPLQTFFNRKAILRRSSLRFKLLFNRKAILRRSSLRFKLFLTERQFCGGARSASNFYLIERQFCGGVRSASNFYLIESNSAAELAPLQTFI